MVAPLASEGVSQYVSSLWSSSFSSWRTDGDFRTKPGKRVGSTVTLTNIGINVFAVHKIEKQTTDLNSEAFQLLSKPFFCSFENNIRFENDKRNLFAGDRYWCGSSSRTSHNTFDGCIRRFQIPPGIVQKLMSRWQHCSKQVEAQHETSGVSREC